VNLDQRKETMKNGYVNETLCLKCREKFEYSNEDTFWDEKGSGYSTKLVRCPFCGTIQVVKYVEDKSLDLNNDPRYY